jgi:nucleoside-diphosphate-sugar epimerase
MVYGPESPGWTTRLTVWARNGHLPLIEGGRGTAYPIYIDNLIDLLILCMVHPAAAGETFNAVDDGPVTLGKFLGAYMAMVPTRRAIRLPGWLFSVLAGLVDPLIPGIKLTYVASQMRGRGMVLNSRAKECLGWLPSVSLADGMRRSEAWLRSREIL